MDNIKKGDIVTAVEKYTNIRVSGEFHKYELEDESDYDSVIGLVFDREKSKLYRVSVDSIQLAESEDERIRKDLIAFICQFAPEHLKTEYVAYLEKQKCFQFGYPGLYFYDGEKLHFQGNPAMEEKQKEQKSFSSYDMAKCFIEGQDYVIRHPEKFELQKPAEWKEEDEGMLNCIIATLCEESHGGRESNGKMVTWLENRLKSLRPQPHWKPSKK